ncbi:hypothetical protein [Streptomyces sp. NPDC014006]|uniref:hypothetical protein n=1 Tax=Streptomyces sp. NPDC014006 TaxID=3364870 RepID=UPI0036FE0B75
MPTVHRQQAFGDWTLDERLGDAAALRDAVSGQSAGAARVATWTAAVHTQTGEIATTCSGHGSCAEITILEVTNWDPDLAVFTPAMRLENLKDCMGKIWQEKAICDVCEVLLPDSSKLEGAYRKERRWPPG